VTGNALDETAIRRLSSAGRGQVVGIDYTETVPSPIAGYPRDKAFDEAKRQRQLRDGPVTREAQ